MNRWSSAIVQNLSWDLSTSVTPISTYLNLSRPLGFSLGLIVKWLQVEWHPRGTTWVTFLDITWSADISGKFQFPWRSQHISSTFGHHQPSLPQGNLGHQHPHNATNGHSHPLAHLSHSHWVGNTVVPATKGLMDLGVLDQGTYCSDSDPPPLLSLLAITVNERRHEIYPTN